MSDRFLYFKVKVLAEVFFVYVGLPHFNFWVFLSISARFGRNFTVKYTAILQVRAIFI